jgi:DNA mismatch repair protein MutS
LAKKKSTVTPLMKQYNAIKQKHPDALLLFRVGDFYETFGEDAVKTAQILNIVLTNRNNGGERTELAGFPHHSLNTYLPKLVKAGQRVAICDQLEDPKATKNIVKRGVTELVTPGVALNDEVLKSKSNNFLCAIHFAKTNIGVAFLDISTGEFLTSEGSKDYIDKLLQNFSPSEVLVSKSHKSTVKEAFKHDLHLFYLENWLFKIDYAQDTLNAHFETSSLKGFGIEHLESGIIAAGAVMHYLSETRHDKLQHINTISRISEDAYVWMDRFTIRNLELYQGNAQQSVTLLDVIDKTISAMGSRLLKRWLSLPLKQKDKIEERLNAVEYLNSHQSLLQNLQQQLKKISDLERLISKIATQKVNPRELLQLKDSLDAIIPIKNELAQHDNEALKVIADNINTCDLLREKIETCIQDEAPVLLNKGNVIAKGFNEELDELRQLAFSGKDYLDDMVKRETERTGISKLKIGSNNVFGYYLEVRHSNKDKVPEDWIRKQTLVNAERYITEELKTYESKILSAEEKISVLEAKIYNSLVVWCQDYIKPVQQNASLVAKLDVLSGFAQLALEDQYKKPIIHDGYSLDIKGGRHPVIEKQLPEGEAYIANNVYLDREEQQIIMITGPNMSGKSAMLRQTAIIVLLAQMGCFVPAESAEIGIVDKIFTRVGASDNISMGESTFMVEMNETASILNNISERSLVLLDEIGRGTSTYDGVSIAWAITEYLHEHPTKAKSLFATHYHELNEMTHTFERIKNFNVSVKEYDNKILFLRTLKPGGSAHSFGIHVARLAGMPQHVIHKAEKILKKLEDSRGTEDRSDALKKVANDDSQLSFFQLDDPLLEGIKQEILNLDINILTPVEALMKLNEIKRMLGGKT